MSEQQDKTFELDGTRPIASGEMEVADTFEEDGTRPIGESPDFLLQNNEATRENQNSAASDRDLATETDNQYPVDDDRVVDTFEEDGTRPIMENEYEVVDTLGIDGNRPITNESYISQKS